MLTNSDVDYLLSKLNRISLKDYARILGVRNISTQKRDVLQQNVVKYWDHNLDDKLQQEMGLQITKKLRRTKLTDEMETKIKKAMKEFDKKQQFERAEEMKKYVEDLQVGTIMKFSLEYQYGLDCNGAGEFYRLIGKAIGLVQITSNETTEYDKPLTGKFVGFEDTSLMQEHNFDYGYVKDNCIMEFKYTRPTFTKDTYRYCHTFELVDIDGNHKFISYSDLNLITPYS